MKRFYLSFLAILVCMLLSTVFAGASTFDVEHSAVSTKPFTEWTSGFLSGNGNLGVIMNGQPYDESLVITGKFYLPIGTKEIVPDLSAYKDEFKKAGLEAGVRGPAVVHGLMLEKTGFGIKGTDPLHPAFFLKLTMPEQTGEFTNYRMTQDFSSGQLEVRWSDQQGDWRRKVFVSRPDNVVVMLLEGPKGKVSYDIAMEIEHQLVKVKPMVSDGWLLSHNTYVKGKGGYDTLVRVLPKGGAMTPGEKGLAVKNADSILLIMQAKRWLAPLPKDQSEGWITSPENPIYGKGHKTNLLADMKKSILELGPDYGELLAAHVKVHADLYRRVNLDLDGGADRHQTSEELMKRAVDEGVLPRALAERMYNACRYLIISSAGDTPPNLQGNWTGSWNAAWSGDYTLDSNLQLEVQSMMSCNMPELMEAYFDLVDSWVPDWRLNAKKMYGFRGVVSNARASNVCLLLHWGAQWPGEQAAIGLAGWLLHFYYDYYQFTGDTAFLEERFVPLAKEIALFYEDFLSGTEGPDGKYRFYMGYSPEHGLHANTTFDISVAKNVFSTLIEASEILGIEQGNLPKWQSILDKMPPYLRNERGELKEWSWPGVGESYNQRHHSRFLTLYQFCEFNRHTTPEMWEAADLAFRQKVRGWLRNPNSNSRFITHGMMNQGQCAARLGRSDIVYEVISRLATQRYLFPNFMMSYWPDLSYMNFSPCYGFDPIGTLPDVMNNSLIFNWKNEIDILPALPKEWPTGSVSGMLLREQIKLNKLGWDIPAGKASLNLLSGKTQTVTLQLPPGIAMRTVVAAGKTIDQEEALSSNVRKIILEKNVPIQIEITFDPGDFAGYWQQSF